MSSRNLLDNAINKLKRSNLVSVSVATENGLGPDHAAEELTLTEDGIERASRMPSETQIEIDELFKRYAAGEITGTLNVSEGDDTLGSAATVSDPPAQGGQSDTPQEAAAQLTGTAGMSVEAEVIPAADRFVTIDPKSPAYQDVEAKFREFEQVLWRNDAPQDVAKNRDAISRDIEVLKTALRQGSVRARAVYEYAKPALIAGLENIGDGFLKAAGVALLAAIMTLLGMR